MSIINQQRVFGSRRRSEVLVMLVLLESTYPTELARLLSAPLFSIQNILQDLEDQGLVASRRQGRMRFVALDPRYFAYKELQALLERLAEAEPELDAAASQRRSRPVQRRRLA